MRIKKKFNNTYLRTQEGLWVRDFTQKAPPIDINSLTNDQDIRLFLKNELENVRKINSAVLENLPTYPNIVIVSDGYDFDACQETLAELPYQDVKILAVNRSLAMWKMVGEQAAVTRAISYYVVNNPFKEAERYVPRNHRYFPNCVASTRTSPLFTNKYEGTLLFYTPSPDQIYSPQIKAEIFLDDYRNSICSAIHLAYLLGVKKLLLFCCDDSFDDERPAAVKLENGLWTYPQQIMSQRLIDGCLYWLKKQNVKIGHFSKGIKLDYSNYIELDKIKDFFDGEEDG